MRDAERKISMRLEKYFEDPVKLAGLSHDIAKDIVAFA
jgi:HD superfamily phosphohydrolase YqeK